MLNTVLLMKYKSIKLEMQQPMKTHKVCPSPSMPSSSRCASDTVNVILLRCGHSEVNYLDASNNMIKIVNIIQFKKMCVIMCVHKQLYQ